MNGFDRTVGRLGERIRRLRQAQGLTQKGLAEKADVFDVGELERARKVKGGTVNPRIETLYRIAVALDVSFEELFGHPPLDEEAVRITRLLEGQDPSTRGKAVRLLEVLVQG